MRISEIQKINRERADRWHGGDFKKWSGLEWAGALCGEAGEAANVAKKIRRIEVGVDGNAWSDRPLNGAALIEALAGECADTFLYLCLLASRYDIDLETVIVDKFNAKSLEMGFPERLRSTASREVCGVEHEKNHPCYMPKDHRGPHECYWGSCREAWT